MRLDQARWWVLPIAMMLPIGCKDSVGTDGAPSTENAPAAATATATAAVTAAAPARAERNHGHARRGAGPVAMLLHAAHDLELTDAQKPTVEKLAGDLHGAGPRQEIKDLHASLIAGVRAGKIDTAKLSTSYDAIDKAMAARHDKEAAALDGLYAALEPAQRKALVASMRAKQAAREEHAATREKKAGDGEWTTRKLDRLTRDLDLDAAQQKSVAAQLEKGDHPTGAAMATHREEAKKRLDALLTAFEGDGFAAAKLELEGPGKLLRGGLEHRIQFLSALLPLLRPEQREKLASAMDKNPAVRGEQGAQHDEEHPYQPVFDEPADDEAPRP